MAHKPTFSTSPPCPACAASPRTRPAGASARSTTWTDLIRAGLPPLFDGLKLAAREIGGVQIQNRGTLAGNICTASPAGDGIPNLLALDAERRAGEPSAARRVVPMRDFIDGYRHTACRADEIVTALRIPKPSAAARSAFLKLGARRYLVISIVMAAAVVETDADGAIAMPRLAIGVLLGRAAAPAARSGGAASRPVRSRRRRRPSCKATILPISLPIDDIAGSAAYRHRRRWR